MFKIKLTFFDTKKNNAEWWDRLFDRINSAQNRSWLVSISDSSQYGSSYALFNIIMKDGNIKMSQNIINEIVYVFIIDQLNIEKIEVNDQDVTNQLNHR